MSNFVLIYPMVALAGLTFIMMFLLLLLRVKSVRTRKVSPRYFKLNKGGELPDNVLVVSQNYNNLLELPVLFYAVCIIAIILNQTAEYFVYHAWIYVSLRYIHSYIHITYNNIIHRLMIFGLSCFVLISMWVKVILLIS
jgi:hypothetical protein